VATLSIAGGAKPSRSAAAPTMPCGHRGLLRRADRGI